MHAATGGRLALALVCLCCAACDPSREKRGVGDENGAIEIWLSCVECQDAEVDSLRAVAARDKDVAMRLRDVLIHGPDSTRRHQLAAQIEANYASLEARAARNTPPDVLPLTRQQYVDHYLASAVLIYRGRAALGLGLIGDSIARQALDSALKSTVDTLPPSVGRDVRYAFDSLLTSESRTRLRPRS